MSPSIIIYETAAAPNLKVSASLIKNKHRRHYLLENVAMPLITPMVAIIKTSLHRTIIVRRQTKMISILFIRNIMKETKISLSGKY